MIQKERDRSRTTTGPEDPMCVQARTTGQSSLATIEPLEIDGAKPWNINNTLLYLNSSFNAHKYCLSPSLSHRSFTSEAPSEDLLKTVSVR